MLQDVPRTAPDTSDRQGPDADMDRLAASVRTASPYPAQFSLTPTHRASHRPFTPQRLAWRTVCHRVPTMLLRLSSCVLLLSALFPIADTIAAESTTMHASHAWARPMPPGARVGAGYVEIHNGGATTRRLIGADCPRASSMEIHTMAEVDGVMRMRRLPEGIEIVAGAHLALKPGAEHLMFFNPDPPFAEGEKIPVTLHFDGDESITVEFEVADRSGKVSGAHARH